MSVSLSTHVLDTGRGEPARGVRVELLRGGELVGSGRPTTTAASPSSGRSSTPGTALSSIHPRRSSGRVELEVSLDDGTTTPARSHHSDARATGVLSRAELEELFSGPSMLVSVLAEVDDPLGRADEIAAGLSEEDKIEAFKPSPGGSASRRPSSTVATRR